MLNLIHGDNILEIPKLYVQPDLIYSDCIYESLEFSWANLAHDALVKNGVFILQTDYHTVAEWKLYLDKLYGKQNFINWLIYKQEWGGVSKRFFPRKHDDILIYSKGKNYKFYYERVMIPKATAGTAFDKRGDGLKIPCDVMDDLGNFSTVSKERVKMSDGKGFKWQKPQKLFDRIITPFCDEDDHILDTHMGIGSLGIWCKNNNRNYVGIEMEKEYYDLAVERVQNI